MSILFFEGFETVGTETGYADRTTVVPRMDLRWSDFRISGADTDYPYLIDDSFSEGFAIRMGEAGSGSNYMTWSVPKSLHAPAGPSAPSWVVGFRFHVPDIARDFLFFQIQGQFVEDSEQRQVSFSVENSTDISINRGTLGAFHTTTDLLTPGSWHYIEIEFKNAEEADGGFIKVYINKVLSIDLDPVDANHGMTVASTSGMKFETANVTSAAEDYVGYDDIYILHKDVAPHQQRLGSVRVNSLPLESDSFAVWDNDAGSGTNFDHINENGADDADYIETDRQNDQDVYHLTDTALDSGVFAVKLEAEAINITGGTPSLEFQLNSNGSWESTKVTVDDLIDYALFDSLFQQDPDTSAMWTAAAIDDLKVALKLDNELA